ncbi:MAG: ribosome biogenesis GTPase Der [Phycisphaerales bacterium]
MPIPRVAIVGRPNVGKSSIMNMLAGAKVSIVDPTPGVTRDRVTAIVEIPPPVKVRGEQHNPSKPVEFVDTGGFGVYVTEGGRFDEVGNDLARLTESIEAQIQHAVEGADLILFVLDAQAGVTPHDLQIAKLLREGGFKKGAKGKRNRVKLPPIRVVANKVDGPRWEAHAAEIAGLGFGEPLLVSAKNNYMRREFSDTLYELVPLAQEEEAHRAAADLLIAIIGKRNAGKSTLINTLAGEERVIASEIPGTTRDAVDVRFEVDGKTVIAIDTAGLRRKRSFQNMIEHYAFDRVQRSIDRADVVLLLIDAAEKISQVDEQLAMLAQKAYKPAIVVVNKWDAVEGQRDPKGRPVTTRMFEEYVRKELQGLWYAPIAIMSGESGLNVRATLRLAFDLHEQAASRVTTGKLNRMVRAIIEQRGPTDIRGRFAKVYYVAQTGVQPPTITMVVNYPEMFTPNYLRFLGNRFREELEFSEVPIRIVVRARRQREDDLVEATEGGEGATLRVSRGRKGVKQRLAGRRLDGSTHGPEGDQWLSDEFSTPVEDADLSEVSEDASDYFDQPAPSAAAPPKAAGAKSRTVRKQRKRAKLSDE